MSSWPHFSISGRLASTALFTTAASSTRSLRSSILPVVMRDTSSRSSTSRVIWCTCRSITSVAHCNSGTGGPLARKICTALRIGASGLRSSWASIARNSSLRRSDSLSAAKSLAFSMAMTARWARSSAAARSVASYTRPDSAVINVSAPSVLARERSGTQIKDFKPNCRMIRRWSSSSADSTSRESGSIAIQSGSPVRSTFMTPWGSEGRGDNGGIVRGPVAAWRDRCV